MYNHTFLIIKRISGFESMYSSIFLKFTIIEEVEKRRRDIASLKTPTRQDERKMCIAGFRLTQEACSFLSVLSLEISFTQCSVNNSVCYPYSRI